MTQMNMIQALNSAMDVMMARDASVVTMGFTSYALRRAPPTTCAETLDPAASRRKQP